MDSVQYGKVQGFLLALETFNNDSLANGEYCEFTFLHVPATGTVSQSLVAHIQTRVRELSPRAWRAKPVLEPVADWSEALSAALSERLYWVAPPTPTIALRHASHLMGLLNGFFDNDEPKCWSLKWSTVSGGDTYPWSVAFPVDWVFEHPNSGEWFHLTLIYSD